MTLEKLKQYNGQNRQKAYVAFNGNIYDVSSSPLWKDGIHKKIHQAGMDLTSGMEHAPHAEEVFADFIIVDSLDDIDENKIHLIKWYRKYHPHPMLSHFPIALHLFAVGLNIIFLFDQKESYATAIFYTFSVAIFMGFFAMLSGLLSWWINYQMALTDIFIIKIFFSLMSLILGIVGIMIYLDNPQVMYLSTFLSTLYHSIIFITGMSVIVLAHSGAKLTWTDKESS